MRHLRHWWETVLLLPVTEWCKDCDDTGIEEYSYGIPRYCWHCKKGNALTAEKKRQERIAGLEQEALR